MSTTLISFLGSSAIKAAKIADLKKESGKSAQATVVESLPDVPVKTSDSLKPAVVATKDALHNNMSNLSRQYCVIPFTMKCISFDS